MLKSSLCDYSDAYILGTGRITVNGAGDDAAAREADEKNKGRILETVQHLLIVKLKQIIQKQIMLKILIQ